MDSRTEIRKKEQNDIILLLGVFAAVWLFSQILMAESKPVKRPLDRTIASATEARVLTCTRDCGDRVVNSFDDFSELRNGIMNLKLNEDEAAFDSLRSEIAVMAEDMRMRIADAPYLSKSEKVQLCGSVGMINNLKSGKANRVETGTVVVNKNTVVTTAHSFLDGFGDLKQPIAEYRFATLKCNENGEFIKKRVIKNGKREDVFEYNIYKIKKVEFAGTNSDGTFQSPISKYDENGQMIENNIPIDQALVILEKEVENSVPIDILNDSNASEVEFVKGEGIRVVAPGFQHDKNKSKEPFVDQGYIRASNYYNYDPKVIVPGVFPHNADTNGSASGACLIGKKKSGGLICVGIHVGKSKPGPAFYPKEDGEFYNVAADPRNFLSKRLSP